MKKLFKLLLTVTIIISAWIFGGAVATCLSWLIIKILTWAGIITTTFSWKFAIITWCIWSLCNIIKIAREKKEREEKING